MSDEKKEVQLVEIKITLDPKTGQVSIGGPLTDAILCLGLLEMAKVSLLEFRQKQIASATLKVPANGMPQLPHP